MRVKIDYLKVLDKKLSTLTGHVVKNMTGNTNFPSPPITPVQLRAALKDYIKALVATARGGIHETIVKDEKKAVVTSMLHDMAVYVNTTAKGNASLLARSGFPMIKQRGPVGVINAPERVKVKTRDFRKEIHVTVPRNPAAKVYIYLYTDEPVPEKNVDWKTAVSVSSKKTITGLESGDRHWVKVAYMATSDTLRFTGAISIIVQ